MGAGGGRKAAGKGRSEGGGGIGGGDWPGTGGWAPPPAEELDLELRARLVLFFCFFFLEAITNEAEGLEHYFPINRGSEA